jgi:hypothetical protein
MRVFVVKRYCAGERRPAARLRQADIWAIDGNKWPTRTD